MGRERGHNLEYEWRFVAEEQGLGYWIGILRASIRGKGNSAKSQALFLFFFLNGLN